MAGFGVYLIPMAFGIVARPAVAELVDRNEARRPSLFIASTVNLSKNFIFPLDCKFLYPMLIISVS